MPGPDHYRTMTDAQLAEWDQLCRRAQHAAEQEAAANRKANDAAAVASVLRTELALTIQSVRAFLGALVEHTTALNRAQWPGEVYRAWDDLDEVVKSAAKCLQ